MGEGRERVEGGGGDGVGGIVGEEVVYSRVVVLGGGGEEGKKRLEGRGCGGGWLMRGVGGEGWWGGHCWGGIIS